MLAVSSVSMGLIRGAYSVLAGVLVLVVLGVSGAPADALVRLFEPKPVLAELAAPAPSTITSEGVDAAIGEALTGGALGPDVSAFVVSASDGRPLFDRQAQTPRIPASSVKILTAVGVLSTLGPDHTLTTAVRRDATTLFVVGAGDPSLRGSAEDVGIGPTLENLARRTAQSLKQLGDTGPFTLAADISLFSGPDLAEGWNRADVADCYVRPVVALMTSVPPAGACRPQMEPQMVALETFGDYLQQAGVQIVGRPVTEAAPPEATPVAHVTSPPMSALVEAMMLDSDNTGAELLAHLAGVAAVGEGSFVGGSTATLQALTDLGIGVEGLVLDDASGMSELNQVTMTSIVGALQAAGSPDHRTTLWPTIAGLPAAGFDGTLASRFGAQSSIAGRGEVRAKTGTLTGISALAGQVITDSGELLTFAFVSNSTTNTTAARAQLDEAAADLAACGCN